MFTFGIATSTLTDIIDSLQWTKPITGPSGSPRPEGAGPPSTLVGGGGGCLVYGRMRDGSGPTGLRDGPPIGGLGLKLVVGRAGGVVEMEFVWGGGREGGWVRVERVVSRSCQDPAASSLEGAMSRSCSKQL